MMSMIQVILTMSMSLSGSCWPWWGRVQPFLPLFLSTNPACLRLLQSEEISIIINWLVHLLLCLVVYLSVYVLWKTNKLKSLSFFSVPSCLGHPGLTGKRLSSPRKIILLFLFGFEADVLEIALRQQHDLVDKIFLVESTQSHRGVSAWSRGDIFLTERLHSRLQKCWCGKGWNTQSDSTF